MSLKAKVSDSFQLLLLLLLPLLLLSHLRVYITKLPAAFPGKFIMPHHSRCVNDESHKSPLLLLLLWAVQKR